MSFSVGEIVVFHKPDDPDHGQLLRIEGPLKPYVSVDKTALGHVVSEITPGVVVYPSDTGVVVEPRHLRPLSDPDAKTVEANEDLGVTA